MIELQEIDMSGFNRFKDGLLLALIGTGQDGDLHKLVDSEVRQLSWEIAREIAPNRAKGEQRMEKDIKRVFAPGPQTAFEQSKRKPLYGETDITWLYAGPAFLVGVRDEDIQIGMSLEAMKKTLSEQRAAGYPRGKAWESLGARGRQHVQRHNRTLVSRERFAGLVKLLSSRIGRQAATFAYAAWKLGKKSIPAWLKAHFGTVASDGAAIFRVLGQGDNYTIEFGSKTPGIVSNPHIREKINTAIENRAHKLKEKMAKILAGYTYDWETGRVFRRNRGEEMLRELEANEQAFEEAA